MGSFLRIAPKPAPRRSARLKPLDRQSFVIRLAARIVPILTLAALLAPAATPSLDDTLKAIENHYNHADSLKLDFSELYVTAHRPAQNESGVLYLRKPGRMRWEYSSPAGKLFLADGKNAWLYTPESHRAEKSPLKMSDDMRAPLAFLLGKLDFHRDFKSFETHKDAAGAEWILALAKNQNLPYTQVEFLATPEGQIHQIRVTNADQSKLEYTFSNEKLNVPTTPNQFVFSAPVGTEVVEAQP
jgi:outer membrane lipoprotein carrier protein